MAERGRRRRAALAAAALAFAAPAQASGEDFVCRGRDPGWELVGDGAKATLLPEKGARRTFSGGVSALPAEGLVTWRGRAGAGQPDLVAVMLRGACTDPMAGGVSTHLGIVSLPSGGSQVGCCTYGGPAVAAAAPPAEPELGEGDADDEAEERQAAALAAPEPPPPPPPPAKAAAVAKAAAAPASLKAGSAAKVAVSARESVNLRTKPGGGKVLGQIAGGRRVVVQQSSRQAGHVWYRVRGRGVPANAWIRGDLLQGG